MTNKAEIKLTKFKILTLYKFTQIDLLNVLSSCNIITKFQLVDHVVNLRQTKKQDVLTTTTAGNKNNKELSLTGLTSCSVG